MTPHAPTEPGPRAGAQALLTLVDELPSVPDTLLRILRVLDDPQSSARNLAEVIRLDAPLTAKILRLANSPYYGGGGLSDVRACIGVLGFKTIRQVAICVSVATRLVPRCGRRPGRLDYRELWRHSVATAVVAKELAQLGNLDEPEEVFTAGLLHDLGKFVAVIHDPAAYDDVVSRRHAAGRPLVEVERELLGWDHALAGEVFGQAWHFPEPLTVSAGLHHEAGARPAGRTGEVAALVGLANLVAHAVVPAACDLGHDSRLVDERAACRAAGLDPTQVEEARPALADAVDRARAYLELA